MKLVVKTVFLTIIVIVATMFAIKGLCLLASGNELRKVNKDLEITREEFSKVNQSAKAKSKESNKEPILSEVVEDVIGGVVHIDCPQWEGSGFVIGPHLIMTARHVVEGCEDFTITTNEGHVLKATRAISHKNYDSGLIYIDDLTCVVEAAEDISCRKGGHEVELQVLEFGSTKNCKLGQNVFAIGSSLGKQHFPNLTFGIISNLNLKLEDFGCPKKYGWSVIWMTDAATYGGNSGCPVFTMEGKVVGVLVGGCGDYESISYCIPVDVFANDIDLIELMFIQDKYQIEEVPDRRSDEMYSWYQWQKNDGRLDEVYYWYLDARPILEDSKQLADVVREYVDLIATYVDVPNGIE